MDYLRIAVLQLLQLPLAIIVRPRHHITVSIAANNNDGRWTTVIGVPVASRLEAVIDCDGCPRECWTDS